MTDRVPFRPVDAPKRKNPRAGGGASPRPGEARVHGGPAPPRGTDRAGLTELFRAAKQAAKRAHAPYSGFSVGAAVQDDHGRIFRGANIENAAYPLGICAERVALQIWLQQGGGRITRAAVYTDTDAATPPCGLCREALVRWAGDAEVFLLYRGRASGPHRAGSWLPR
jgi:cytidine deaminase